MLDPNTLIIFILVVSTPIALFFYYFIAKIAINSAIDEHQGGKNSLTLIRWIIVMFVLTGLAIYALAEKLFVGFGRPEFVEVYQPSSEINIAAILGLIYLCLELPYQLIKIAAKDVAEGLLATGDDRRNVARLKSAETLALIIGRKLKVSCELQAFTSNEEFVFLTYIVNNKPVATRLKLNQADKAESWKKLGEWIMGNYQNPKTQ